MVEVTTARVLADKALQDVSPQACVDWAVGMLVAGYDGQNLAMLAGMLPPFNYFEITSLRDRALAEVNAPDLSTTDAVLVYAAERLRLALDGNADMAETLRAVKDLCVAHDYHPDLYEFYLLFFAQDDLRGSTLQWYWDGATQANIDSIIRDRAERFVAQTRGAA